MMSRAMKMGCLAAVGLIGLGVTGCAKPRFVHAVFFTFKPDTPQSKVEELIGDGQSLLAKVPSVRAVQCGRRDERMTRDVNVQDWDVGLIVWFDDKQGHDLYQDHAVHQEYVGKHMEHLAKVRVFDFVAQE